MTFLNMAVATLVQTANGLESGQTLDVFSWTFMLGSMFAVTTLTGWCFKKVLTSEARMESNGTSEVESRSSGSVQRGKRP